MTDVQIAPEPGAEAATAASPTPPATAPAAPTDEIALPTEDDVMIAGRPVPSNVHTTSFEDESIRAYDFDLYKGRNGVTDRIGILDSSKITFGRVHYLDGNRGGYFLCQSEWKLMGGQEVCTKVAPCCEKLEAPRKRFSCLVIHYNTTPTGIPVSPFGFQLKLWRFSDDRYIVLRDLNSEFPLANHDLKTNCTDDQYQKMTIQACKEKIAAREDFQKKYGAEVAAWVKASSTKLNGTVGRSFGAQELLEKLGMAQAPAVIQQGAAIDDIKDLLAD